MSISSTSSSEGSVQSPFDLTKPETWGPSVYGIDLCINDVTTLPSLAPCIALDVEDDEKGNFVGVGLYDGNGRVLYFSEVSDALLSAVKVRNLVAHNGKSDLHKLRSWGFKVTSKHLVWDTMIASYVLDSTKESHGLKELVFQELGIRYPAYRDIVTRRGKAKQTLDLQPLELVANYNGMDCISTFRLRSCQGNLFSKVHRRYFEELEMPLTRLLFDMEEEGIQVSVPYLQILDAQFGREANGLRHKLHTYCGESFNPNSPAQVSGTFFRRLQISESSTSRDILQRYETIPLVQTLIKYREVQKLRSTYTTPLIELAASSPSGRIHTTFNQVSVSNNGDYKGIRTGRLSSSEPNLQNIPTRTAKGELLRRAFVAKEGHLLVVADYSQIEYRLLAHFSQEPRLLQAFREGKDVHEETGRSIGADRKLGKTINFGSVYGCQAEKVAQVAKIPVHEAEEFLATYWEKLPYVKQYIQETHKAARSNGTITTLFGRVIKLPDISSSNRYVRMGAERQSVNYHIQGSAAEIIKVAMLRAAQDGLRPICTVHDELIFEVKEADAESVAAQVKSLMEGVVKLSIPLVAEVGIGKSWADAK